jgi:ubiquinone biosynthesis accessory factor UbiJ
MNTSSPFSLPFTFPPDLQSLPAWLQPPAWLVREVQQRIVLALNHVLQQEPEAMARLARQKGRVARINAAQLAIELIATPAGLLDLAPADSKADLTLTVTDSNPLSLLQTTLKGEKPAIQVQGDVQLAAEVNWLVDHVRWDVEEDLSRIMGDAPAHGLVQVLRQAGETLRKFAPTPASKSAPAPTSAPTSAATSVASPAAASAPAASAASTTPPSPATGAATGFSG